MTMIGFVMHTHTCTNMHPRLHVHARTRTHTHTHTLSLLNTRADTETITNTFLLLYVCLFVCCRFGPYQNTALQLNEYLLAVNMTDCMLQCVSEFFEQGKHCLCACVMVWQKAMLSSKCVSKDCFTTSPCFTVNYPLLPCLQV